MRRCERCGGKGGAQSSPELDSAFRLAREKGMCPHEQKGICSFGADCQNQHGCVIDSNHKGHAAYNCPDLGTPTARKALGP